MIRDVSAELALGSRLFEIVDCLIYRAAVFRPEHGPSPHPQRHRSSKGLMRQSALSQMIGARGAYSLAAPCRVAASSANRPSKQAWNGAKLITPSALPIAAASISAAKICSFIFACVASISSRKIAWDGPQAYLALHRSSRRAVRDEVQGTGRHFSPMES